MAVRPAPELSFSVIDTVCDAGGDTPNEDAFDATLNAVWVIDGVSGLEPTSVDGQTAPQWFAGAVSSAFAHHLQDSPEAPTLTLLNRAVRDCRTVWDGMDLADASRPAATFAMIRLVDGEVEFTSIGDCSVRYRPAGSDDTATMLFMDMSVEPFDRKSVNRLRELQAALPDASHAELVDILKAGLRNNRRFLNRKDGYNALSLSPLQDWNRVTHRQALGEGTGFLLASDGVSRYCDTLDLGSSDALYAAAMTEPLEAILARIRGTERSDPSCRTFPRIKLEDDATAVTVRLVAR